jgi:hypothetical protein
VGDVELAGHRDLQILETPYHARQYGLELYNSFPTSAVVRDRLFLDEKIDVVDSERSKLLIRALESHEQPTKRNVRLAARY